MGNTVCFELAFHDCGHAGGWWGLRGGCAHRRIPYGWTRQLCALALPTGLTSLLMPLTPCPASRTSRPQMKSMSNALASCQHRWQHNLSHTCYLLLTCTAWRGTYTALLIHLLLHCACKFCIVPVNTHKSVILLSLPLSAPLHPHVVR